MKKVLQRVTSVLMAGVLWLAFGFPSQAAGLKTPTLKAPTLEQAYENVMAYAAERGIELSMTMKDFADNYNGQSITAYEQSYYKLFKAGTLADSSFLDKIDTDKFEIIDFRGGAVDTQSSSSSSSSNKSGGYYYNTGTSCPSKATYSKYNLLNTVKKGDIIYEAAGFFYIAGHIAVVEGVYSRPGGGKYIRVIEAIDDGVVRSILDDTRIDERDGHVLRVKNASGTVINNAVSFCVGELGSSYSLDFAHDRSASETDWYCSELAWAAYKNQGIDIETTGWLNEPGITPRDIYRSNKVSSVNIN
ncbi:MAG: hypothetical protein IKR39_01625 [Lachnospiraceae bacterium]|nr:hypothetical protein [Lachnospiraceae bacterium]